MKKIIIGVFVILAVASIAMIRADLTRSVNIQRTMSAVGPISAFRSGGVYIGPGLRSHVISWQSGGDLTGCAIKLEKSSNGTTWSDLIVNHICTTNGSSAIVEDQASQIRLNLTTFTPATASSIVVTYGGYLDSPDINIYGTKQLWRSVTGSVVTTADNDIIAASSTMGYCLTSVSTYNSSAYSTVLNLYEDGSTGTLKGVLAAPAGGGSAWSFPSPICFAVGKKVTVAEATPATVYVTIAYFQTPTPPDSIATTTSSTSSSSTSSTSTTSTSTTSTSLATTSSTSSTSTSTSTSLEPTTTSTSTSISVTTTSL